MSEVKLPKFNVYNVKEVPISSVSANGYNPNVVASVEMKLLITSIDNSGFCFPVIVIEESVGKYIVVDGYHRYKVLRDHYNSPTIPVVVLDLNMDQRMASTVRFNRARGSHKIDGDANIVMSLSKNGMTDSEISKNLGMSLEEILRLKQSTGLKEAFANHEFSKSWEELKERLYKD